MGITVRLLDQQTEEHYEDFLLGADTSLFYASNKFRKLLRDFLGAEDIYFIAVDENGELRGALPSFLKVNPRSGNVLNSLPFYGSNGGVIVHDNDREVQRMLIQAFNDFAKTHHCVASTLVSSPLNLMEALYEEATQYTFKDSRIGQLTPLPAATESIDDEVMELIDSKMRNLIRKAIKLEISTHGEQGQAHLDFLIATHQENMSAIGGIAKEEQFFRLIQKHFIYGSDYKILYAKKGDTQVAALLLFYFNKTVEYYTPVIKAEHRNSQPMCLLIFEAMKEAVALGYRWWNWGGTWTSQGGVYHFKSQWGTEDKNYYYYTKIINDDILKSSKEQLLKEYPYFFVVPFHMIQNQEAS